MRRTLFAALLFAGCYNPDYASKSCIDDKGCPEGYFCVAGKCSPSSVSGDMTDEDAVLKALRTNTACSIPGSCTSPTKQPVPASRRWSSRRSQGLADGMVFAAASTVGMR